MTKKITNKIAEKVARSVQRGFLVDEALALEDLTPDDFGTVHAMVAKKFWQGEDAPPKSLSAIMNAYDEEHSIISPTELNEGTAKGGLPQGRRMVAYAATEFFRPHMGDLFATLLDQASEGDMQAMKMIMAYALPAPKNESFIQLPQWFNIESEDLEMQSDLVIQAVAAGEISVETGDKLLSMLEKRTAIMDRSKTSKRLAQLEEAFYGGGGMLDVTPPKKNLLASLVDE